VTRPEIIEVGTLYREMLTAQSEFGGGRVEHERSCVAMAFQALCSRPQFIVRATVLGENLTRDHQRACASRALCVCRLASARRISQSAQEFPMAGSRT
jgi:hypothetical protein